MNHAPLDLRFLIGGMGREVGGEKLSRNSAAPSLRVSFDSRGGGNVFFNYAEGGFYKSNLIFYRA